MSRMLANALESQTGQDGRLANIWDMKTKGTCENSCFTTADKSPEQNKRLLSADRAYKLWEEGDKCSPHRGRVSSEALVCSGVDCILSEHVH